MALAKSRSFSDASGFTIMEVMVASLVFTVGVLSLAQLFMVATMANRTARATTSTMVLAQQKMEQLRGLTWSMDTTVNLPLSDMTTDVSTVPFSTGGTGLQPSPMGTLIGNVRGFVDYLDENGRWLGNGGVPPPGTVFIRRWSIEPLPANPNNTLILQVLVTRTRNRGTADQDNVRRLPDEARLISVKTRKTS